MTQVAFNGAISNRVPVDSIGQQGNAAAQLRATLAAIRAEKEGRPDPRWLDQVIRSRRLRHRFFSEGLFSDPAWDMLLELFAAELGQRKVSVTSLCIASQCPSTTALRHLKRMFAEGLVAKQQDGLDGRRRFVQLTPCGLEAMENYIASVPQQVPPL